MGLSVWRGKFNKNAGTVTLDKAAGSGSVDITIDVTSIDFGLDIMNSKAREPDLFDTAKYPNARYTGRLEGFANGAPSRVVGELTLHGVTKPVTLAINSFKCMPHPMLKRDWCGADASGHHQPRRLRHRRRPRLRLQDGCGAAHPGRSGAGGVRHRPFFLH